MNISHQEGTFVFNIVKSEIEVKDEPLDTEEEDALSDQVSDQVFGLNKNKILLSDTDEGKGLKAKNILASLPQASGMSDQTIKKNYEKNQSWTYGNIVCKNEDELKSHLKTRTPILKCAHCSYESKRKGNLIDHLQIHSSVKLYKCQKCNYESSVKLNYRRHLIKHANIKLFKCSECIFECKRKEGLIKHMLKHGNIKLFKCFKCNYECNDKGNFNRHILRHGNIKLFKCPECNYECNDKGNFNKHRLIHANIKLFKCSECNFGCIRKESLKRHMQRHQEKKKIRSR